MRKLLFFDNQSLQTTNGLAKELSLPTKSGKNPLFKADLPWELGNMTLYGTVLKAPDSPFQAWYTIIDENWRFFLAYAESEDGLAWERPGLNFFSVNGKRTNIVLASDPHGPAIIYDETEPRVAWRYKMLCGAKPGGSICGYHSADGINWQQVGRYPLITTGPDCPMGLVRHQDGRYIAYHRVYGTGRRVFRSESWDFIHWSSEPKLVFEPDAGDPPLIQFYGLGSSMYGHYELGTLWIYHVDPADPSSMSGRQEMELAYARSGYAWHRLKQGHAFLSSGNTGSWEQGNIQMSSAPVYLEDEIRFYYAATQVQHAQRWELLPQKGGLGMASLKPDRFVGLTAAGQEGNLVTMPTRFDQGSLYINAAVQPGGQIISALLNDSGSPIPGYDFADCVPVVDDSLAAGLTWRNSEQSPIPADQRIRLAFSMKSATLYAIFQRENGDDAPYYIFSAW